MIYLLCACRSHPEANSATVMEETVVRIDRRRLSLDFLTTA